MNLALILHNFSFLIVARTFVAFNLAWKEMLSLSLGATKLKVRQKAQKLTRIKARNFTSNDYFSHSKYLKH